MNKSVGLMYWSILQSNKGKGAARGKAVHFEDTIKLPQPSSHRHHPSKSADTDEQDEDEVEEDPDEEMEDGFVDLSAMLDDNPDGESSGEEQSESSVSTQEDADELELSGNEESDNLALDQLDNFISSLETKKRKAEDSQSKVPVSKRRLLSDRTEVGPESEFSSGLAASQKGETLCIFSFV